MQLNALLVTELAARIELAIDIALAATESEDVPPKLAHAIRYAVLPGGARVRPTILLSVAMACGEDRPAISDRAAAAIELIHSASLVHDDLPCFDNADLRRGKPSLHRAYSEPLAVLTGDSLVVMAFETLAVAAEEDSIRTSRLILSLAHRTGLPSGICAGQGWESEDKVDLAAYHRAKTGALFVAAAEMGAISAGHDPVPWRDLGMIMGEAYQVADDLRDALHESEMLGKPAGQDRTLERPNTVAEYGVDGALERLSDILSRAITSIPSCEGEAMLAGLVRRHARAMMSGIVNAVAVDKRL